MDAYRQGTLIQNQGIFFAKLGYFSYIFKKRTPLPPPPPPPLIACLYMEKREVLSISSFIEDIMRSHSRQGEQQEDKLVINLPQMERD